MFTTDGWHDLMEDVLQMKEATDTVAGISTEAELNFRKGELSMQNWFLGLSSISEAAYTELKEAE